MVAPAQHRSRFGYLPLHFAMMRLANQEAEHDIAKTAGVFGQDRRSWHISSWRVCLRNKLRRARSRRIVRVRGSNPRPVGVYCGGIFETEAIIASTDRDAQEIRPVAASVSPVGYRSAADDRHPSLYLGPRIPWRAPPAFSWCC
jgi:hypothetical protein